MKSPTSVTELLTQASTKSQRLKRDIVIPAGTIFEPAAEHVERRDTHHETIIGLTNDTSGNMVYYLDPNDPQLAEWFEEVESE